MNILHKEREGFTLLELMIFIVVVIILLAVIISLNSALEKNTDHWFIDPYSL